MTSIGVMAGLRWLVILAALILAALPGGLAAAELDLQVEEERVRVAHPAIFTVRIDGAAETRAEGRSALARLHWGRTDLTFWTSYHSTPALNDSNFNNLNPSEQITTLLGLAKERGLEYDEVNEQLASQPATAIFENLLTIDVRPKRVFPLGVVRYRSLKRAGPIESAPAERSFVVLFDMHSDTFLFDLPGRYEVWAELTAPSGLVVSNKVSVLAEAVPDEEIGKSECAYVAQVAPIDVSREDANHAERIAALASPAACSGYIGVAQALTSHFYAQRLAEWLSARPNADSFEDWTLGESALAHCRTQDRLSESVFTVVDETSCAFIDWMAAWLLDVRPTDSAGRAEALEDLRPVGEIDHYSLIKDVVDAIAEELRREGASQD